MEANPKWRPGSSGPLVSGNPKGPDWPFGAEGSREQRLERLP